MEHCSGKTIQAKWQNYRLFPYEKDLGRSELESISGWKVAADDAVWVTLEESKSARYVGSKQTSSALAGRTSYFERIREGEYVEPTEQAQVEQTHWTLRTTQPRRQATRYGLHGVHEYKGKFNPQTARALLNVVDPDAAVVIDPFCGSGTTLIEGARLGMEAFGLDKSPIARFIAGAKLQATHRQSTDLGFSNLFEETACRVEKAIYKGQRDGRQGLERIGALNDAASSYLHGWFNRDALGALDAALLELEGVVDPLARDLGLLCLSAILRESSLQMPQDLRVRRRPAPFVTPDMSELFANACSTVGRGLEEISKWPALVGPTGGSDSIVDGSAEEVDRWAARWNGRRKVIVTSPPYATALPYIDTDRLSLICLSLADPKQLRHLEADLVGSREWNRPVASRWSKRREVNADALPESVTSLLGVIEAKNLSSGAGFRRAAVPDLLYRYFTQMKDCLVSWREALAPGERAVLVVGRNKSGSRGDLTTIETPTLLGDIAREQGFAEVDLLPFEAWPRFGLHSANGVDGEDAVLLTR